MTIIFPFIYSWFMTNSLKFISPIAVGLYSVKEEFNEELEEELEEEFDEARRITPEGHHSRKKPYSTPQSQTLRFP
jgi:hypothetical protein